MSQVALDPPAATYKDLQPLFGRRIRMDVIREHWDAVLRLVPSRSVVAEQIERKFSIRLGATAEGALLAKLGLTPQKPLQRATSFTATANRWPSR